MRGGGSYSMGARLTACGPSPSTRSRPLCVAHRSPRRLTQSSPPASITACIVAPLCPRLSSTSADPYLPARQEHAQQDEHRTRRPRLAEMIRQSRACPSDMLDSRACIQTELVDAADQSSRLARVVGDGPVPRAQPSDQRGSPPRSLSRFMNSKIPTRNRAIRRQPLLDRQRQAHARRRSAPP